MTSHSKRRLFSPLLIVAIACIVNACGTSEPQSGVAEIHYWRALSGSAGDAQDELVDRFNASQSAVRVTSEFQGSYGDLATKLLTAAAARSGPEVTQLGTFEIRKFARSGVLVDLKPYLDGPRGIDRSDWPAGMARAGEVDGGIYWVPFNVAVPVLYYNKEAFSEAGITGPPQTWADFFDFARQLTQKDTRAGVALWNITWPVFSMIWSEGGELTTPDYRSITLNDPIVVHLMTELQQLVRDGAATMPDKASGGHRSAFVNGRAAMILDSQDAMSEVFEQARTFTPALASFPAGAAGKVFAPGGGGLSMFATTPEDKRDAAWSFMRFMLAPDSIAYYAKRSGYVAYSESARKAAGDLPTNPRYAPIYEAVPHIRADFSVNMSPAVRTAFDEAYQKIMLENADVQQTLDAADAKAERDIPSELTPR